MELHILENIIYALAFTSILYTNVAQTAVSTSKVTMMSSNSPDESTVSIKPTSGEQNSTITVTKATSPDSSSTNINTTTQVSTSPNNVTSASLSDNSSTSITTTKVVPTSTTINTSPSLSDNSSTSITTTKVVPTSTTIKTSPSLSDNSSTSITTTKNVPTSTTIKTSTSSSDNSSTSITTTKNVPTSTTIKTSPSLSDNSSTSITTTKVVPTSTTIKTSPSLSYNSSTSITTTKVVPTSTTIKTTASPSDNSSININTTTAVVTLSTSIESSTKESSSTITVASTSPNDNTSSTSDISTEKATSTTAVPTTGVPTAYPTSKPDLGKAVYIFNFELKIEGNFNDIGEEFEKSLNNTLFENIFKGAPGVRLSFTFSPGSIIAAVKSEIAQMDLEKEKKNITEVLEIMKNNTKHNAAKINTSLGKIQDEKVFKEAFDEEVETYTAKLESDPCLLQSDVCPLSYLYTCENHKNVTAGTCKHSCDVEPGLCGDNGVCFYDIANSVKACKCKTTSFHVYHGEHCEESTATKEFVLAVSLGAGGGIILILFLIIICMCIRRGVNSKHNVSGESEWILPTNEVALKDLSFRSSMDKTSPLYGRYHRSPGHTNQAYEPAFTGSGRGGPPVYLPDEGEQVTSFRNEQYYSSIDPSADYSIKRPYITSKPHDVYDSIYIDNISESTREQQPYITDMKTTL